MSVDQVLQSLILEGVLKADGLRFAIPVNRSNDLFMNRLFGGAQDALLRLSAQAEQIMLVQVLSSFEIPLAAKTLATSERNKAIHCLGAIVRGESPPSDYITAEVTKGLAPASISTGVPVAYGIATTETIEQTINRGGVKAGNTGIETAMTAVEMANLLKEL
jgi:6,7-dimethyl-8-ribityllumazine synthase